MWEQLTPKDIERAKVRLAATRITTLNRHAEELKALDANQAEIDTFERLVVAFAQKHLIPTIAPSSPSMASEEQPAAVEAATHPTHDASQDGHSPIQVVHPPSSNFSVPLRRFVRG
jgi:hypothetical protein